MKLLALLSLLPQLALAADLPRKDDVLEAQVAAVPLRESTPDALFGGKAPQIGWVKKGESVRVLETRQYLTIFGMEIWVEVEKLGDHPAHGWLLDGMSKDILQGKSNLTISSRPESPVDPRAAAAAAAHEAADRLIEDSN